MGLELLISLVIRAKTHIDEAITELGAIRIYGASGT